VWVWCVLLGVLLRLSRLRKPPLAASLCKASLALLLCLAPVACGGGGSLSTGPNNGTPAGTYTLNVTATAQTLSHSSQIILQVK
jgi:hypothetical protein